MVREVGISETQMAMTFGDEVCASLLKDHTTQQNIYWATNSYEKLGEGYSFFDPITLDKITGEGKDQIIRPRAIKTREEQAKRIKDKAEVFTPAWICNAQNNLIDEAWFGRKDGLFNSPDPKDPHKWINNEEKIIFPDTESKTWKNYVADVRLEITCGEAPYLCNRYDVVSGEYNEVAKYRIGLLDRKLRIVSENVDDAEEWTLWGKIALCATYGYEWQGDSLLLAREALFYTFMEHYIERFDEKTFNRNKSHIMADVAYIISWNIWQMDGLSYGLPGYQPHIESEGANVTGTLFKDGEMEEECVVSPHERLCLLKDFFYGVDVLAPNLSDGAFDDQNAPQQTFYSLLSEKPKKMKAKRSKTSKEKV